MLLFLFKTRFTDYAFITQHLNTLMQWYGHFFLSTT